jgi:hypothetical protein
MIVERTKVLAAYQRIKDQLGEQSEDQACMAAAQALGIHSDDVRLVVIEAREGLLS